jgi:transcriptional regulator with XRE-family HTH domain
LTPNALESADIPANVYRLFLLFFAMRATMSLHILHADCMDATTKLHNLKTLGERLRWVREGMGLSLEAFGAAIGYDKSYLSRLESGKTANPSAAFIESVCNKFMILRDWLLAGKGQPVMEDAIVKLAGEIDPSRLVSRVGMAIAMEWELDTVQVIRLLMKDLPLPERLTKGTELLRDPSIKASAKEYWATVFLRAYSDSPASNVSSKSPTPEEQRQQFLAKLTQATGGSSRDLSPLKQKGPSAARK